MKVPKHLSKQQFFGSTGTAANIKHIQSHLTVLRGKVWRSNWYFPDAVACALCRLCCVAVYLKIRPSPMAPDSLGGAYWKRNLLYGGYTNITTYCRFRFVFFRVAETIAIDERQYMIYTTLFLAQYAVSHLLYIYIHEYRTCMHNCIYSCLHREMES